jgi:hypothetical protein
MSTGIGFLHLVTVVRASADAVSEDEFNATLNSAATVGLLVSALMLLFGYRLIIKEIGLRSDSREKQRKDWNESV